MKLESTGHISSSPPPESSWWRGGAHVSGQQPSQPLFCCSRLMCTDWHTSGQECLSVSLILFLLFSGTKTEVCGDVRAAVRINLQTEASYFHHKPLSRRSCAASFVDRQRTETYSKRLCTNLKMKSLRETHVGRINWAKSVFCVSSQRDQFTQKDNCCQ